MMYNRRVTLVRSERKRYDPVSGKMVGGERSEDVVACNISPFRSELHHSLGDKLKDVSLVVRIRPYGERVEGLVIDGQAFVILKTVSHGRRGLVFYVSEEVKRGRSVD